MDVSDGLDSVKIGVKVIFALAGGRTRGRTRGVPDAWCGEGNPESQLVNVLCVLEKHVYFLSVFKKKGVNSIRR